MADGDTRRWSLRDPSGAVRNANVPTALLVQWAAQGLILPGFDLSADGETWAPAETLPELAMTWYVVAPNHAPYGPVAKAAAERLVAEGRFPQGAAVTQDPGEAPVSTELPLAVEQPQPSQELEETRQRLVLLERELRQKDRRIEELRREAEARQGELEIGDKPNAQALAQELAAIRLERDHLQAAAQEAAEAAADREQTLKQRIETLEKALETAQDAAAQEPAPPTGALAELLDREADTLRRAQEEEERFLEQLRSLSRRRAAAFAERIAEIRRIVGEAPGAARATVAPPQSPSARREHEARVAALEKALEEGRARETDLQKRLVALEGSEIQLRAQLTQAQRQTLDSLKLDEKLRETVQALARERAAREEEHGENARIQEQLLRRIEELERTIPALSAQMPPEPEPEPDPEPERPSRGTFDWLRRR